MGASWPADSKRPPGAPRTPEFIMSPSRGQTRALHLLLAVAAAGWLSLATAGQLTGKETSVDGGITLSCTTPQTCGDLSNRERRCTPTMSGRRWQD